MCSYDSAVFPFNSYGGKLYELVPFNSNSSWTSVFSDKL